MRIIHRFLKFSLVLIFFSFVHAQESVFSAPDTDDVMWYKQAQPQQSGILEAGKLSAKENSVIIYVSLSELVKAQAIDLAKKLKKWLDEKEMVYGEVQIIAEEIEDEGAAYSYLVDGLWYKNRETNKRSFSPQDAPSILQDVAITYVAMRTIELEK